MKDYKYKCLINRKWGRIWTIILAIIIILWSLMILSRNQFDDFIDFFFSSSEELWIPLLFNIIALGYWLYGSYKKGVYDTIVEKGKKYKGEVISCDSEYSRNHSWHYLIIEIQKGREKIQFRTEAYNDPPDFVLASKYCDVYEYDGMYYPTNYIMK